MGVVVASSYLYIIIKLKTMINVRSSELCIKKFEDGTEYVSFRGCSNEELVKEMREEGVADYVKRDKEEEE